MTLSCHQLLCSFFLYGLFVLNTHTALADAAVAASVDLWPPLHPPIDPLIELAFSSSLFGRAWTTFGQSSHLQLIVLWLVDSRHTHTHKAHRRWRWMVESLFHVADRFCSDWRIQSKRKTRLNCVVQNSIWANRDHHLHGHHHHKQQPHHQQQYSRLGRWRGTLFRLIISNLKLLHLKYWRMFFFCVTFKSVR